MFPDTEKVSINHVTHNKFADTAKRNNFNNVQYTPTKHINYKACEIVSWIALDSLNNNSYCY